MAEIDLGDWPFTLVDDVFDSGDLFRWVEGLIVIEAILSSFASLTITQSESKCQKILPLHFRDG